MKATPIVADDKISPFEMVDKEETRIDVESSSR
jgi:hypothetical protein